MSEVGRRVMVVNNAQERTGEYEATFLAWGQDYEELVDGAAHFPVAIVEKDDGAVELVYAKLIRFLAKIDGEG